MKIERAPSQDLFSITALRGLAALGVVFFHMRVDLWIGWNELRAGGHAYGWMDRAVAWLSIPTPFMGSGVMLFFLISGFCIALPYAGESGRPLRCGEYLARRLVRIYPPYLATLLFCVLVEVLCLSGGGQSSFKTYVATAFMVQNYTTGQVVSNPSFWSLPVEVELYLLFPLVYAILRRWGVKAVAASTGLVSGFCLLGYYSGETWMGLNAGKFWIIWSGGVILAEWYKLGEMTAPSFGVLGGTGVLLMLTIAGQLKGVSAVLLHFGYGGIYFVLIWWVLSKESRWATLPKMIARPLLFLGTISYSLYLVHFPFFRLCGHYWVQQAGHKPVNFLVPVGFAVLAVGLGWMFYQIIEKPSHGWAKWAGRYVGGKAET